MRKKIVAGNWKMHKSYHDGVETAKELGKRLESKTCNATIILGTSYIHLAAAAAAVDTSKISIAAQNCADQDQGAYTGEVCASMIKSTGADYVIIGHSERRSYYHETPEILKTKVQFALESNLKPIFCVGEALEERKSGGYFDVVKSQLEGSVWDLSPEDFQKLVIAYEPVWAIGTGMTADTIQIEEIHTFIRKIIADKYGQEVADKTPILYGGSCNPGNAKVIFNTPNVDGGLIGGASLKPDDFEGIIDAIQ